MQNYQSKWRVNNEPHRIRSRAAAKVWQQKNAKRLYKQRRARPYEKIAAAIRTRVYNLLRYGYKSKSTQELLGTTYKGLKEHLEKQFKEGMSWENYGFYGWHIDHILPLSSFDLTKAEEQKKAFHYTNLQPLSAKENLQKYSKILIKSSM